MTSQNSPNWQVIPVPAHSTASEHLRIGSDGALHVPTWLRKKHPVLQVVQDHERGAVGFRPAKKGDANSRDMSERPSFKDASLLRALKAEPGDVFTLRDMGGVYVLLKTGGE